MLIEVDITPDRVFRDVVFDLPSAFAYWHAVAPIVFGWLDCTLARKDRHPFYNDTSAIKFASGILLGVDIPCGTPERDIAAFQADCQESLAGYARANHGWRIARMKWEMLYGASYSSAAANVAAECGASVPEIEQIEKDLRGSWAFFEKAKALIEALQTENQTQA